VIATYIVEFDDAADYRIGGRSSPVTDNLRKCGMTDRAIDNAPGRTRHLLPLIT